MGICANEFSFFVSPSLARDKKIVLVSPKTPNLEFHLENFFINCLSSMEVGGRSEVRVR
jgi:hypothetical protein